MKYLHFILLFLLFYLSFNANAQITLTPTYNPVAGDIEKVFSCDTAGIVPGGSGLNQNWNFSNIIKIDSTLTNYLDPVLTPYIDSFQTSNIASFDSTQNPVIYSYYKTSVNKREYMGYAYPDFLEKLSNTQIRMQYPFTYNTSYIDTFSGSGTLSSYTFIVTGTINNIGDAGGTIILPFGTFSNALRVKTISTEIDSNYSFNIVVYNTSVEYSWYVSSFKFPVFIIDYYWSVQNGDTTYGKGIYYCKSQPIGILRIGKNIPASFNLYQNYPNPFNPVTNIKYDLPKTNNVKLIIFDLLGKEVATLVNEKLSAGTYEVIWNGSNYSSGVYFYKLISGDFMQTKKLVLIK